MIRSMTRRLSDVSGVHDEIELGIHVGWVCHEGAFDDCAPIWNERRDVCLIFTGEDFQDDSNLDLLRREGRIVDETKASYLVHLYETFGPSFVERLNGWFSGVVIDRRRARAFLFNDRYGLRRIYFHQARDAFYFASEAKALLEVVPNLKRLDPSAIAEMLSFGCVLENRTLFKGVHLLPGGSLWSFSGKTIVERSTYFDRSMWENRPLLKGAQFYERLKETFTSILPKYFRGGPLAISLTGGLDCRMIMAWGGQAAGSLPCVTFGGVYRECADVRIARRVAQHCRQPHQTITVGAAFLGDFPALAEKTVLVSDGSMDVTGAVEFYVNEIVRRLCRVRLTGNYGSEVIRGHVAFRPRLDRWEVLEPELARLVAIAPVRYREQRACRDQTFIAFKQVPWHHYARLSVEASHLTPRSPFLDNELVGLMYQAPADLLASREPSFRLIAEGDPRLARIPTDRGLSFPSIPVLSGLRSMWEETGAKAEYAYDYGMPQWLASLDHAARPLKLEHLFLGRQKFYHFRVWYRDQLSSYVRDVLLDRRTLERGYLRGAAFRKCVESHLEGRQNHTTMITKMLTLEVVHRTLLRA
ncbi:hypothetical protein HQ394_13345 [Defluviicoccus vanus]|uniref:asparagine synthase (glutamine-hydrolyzing) n=2 Tax=Defluviicoccus vanus TaxID=111831 RepID=A0A7H1N347_9PROT|nr:hypothetical protein HQ394_13345 [Defluviicoccus vanus]